MITTMNYCVRTRNQGFIFKPTRNWDEKDETFEFVIHDWSDSDYMKIQRVGGASLAQ